VSLRTLLGKGFVYLVLEWGALCGVPIRPDEIERLMTVNQPAAVYAERTDDGDGDGAGTGGLP